MMTTIYENDSYLFKKINFSYMKNTFSIMQCYYFLNIPYNLDIKICNDSLLLGGKIYGEKKYRKIFKKIFKKKN